MARNAKYDEKRLLDAVIHYAEIYKGKIVVKNLAEWARVNEPGLEGVQAYNFLRPIIEKDPKTGKTVQKEKLSKIRIQEINDSRSLMTGIQTNMLISSVNMDDFFRQPITVQRQLISDTRLQFQEMTARLNKQSKMITGYKSDIDKLASLEEKIEAQMEDLDKRYASLNEKYNFLCNSIDDEKRRELLKSFGIDENDLDLRKIRKAQKELDVQVNSKKEIIRKYRKQQTVINELEPDETVPSLESAQSESDFMASILEDI